MNPLVEDFAVAMVQLSVRKESMNGVCMPRNEKSFAF